MSLTAAALGLPRCGRIFHNLSYEQLFLHEQRRGETLLCRHDCMAVDTGRFTGRSPQDKYVVQQPPSANRIAWGPVNSPLSPATYGALRERVITYLSACDLYVTDVFCGTAGASRRRVRFITEHAWQSHFCRNMFLRPTPAELADFRPDFTVYNASGCTDDDWQEHGLNSEVFVAFAIEQNEALIGGTSYGGEMKKGLFTMMNYWLPLEGVLPMHCAANVGKEDDVCLFFGLSGTGKTTLATDPQRRLIGDDEHGWDDAGVFNFEGGCYAKTIQLDPEREPQIYHAIRRDALLENVGLCADGSVDFADGSKTENTRCSYPISHIPGHEPGLRGGHPRRIVFLSCDAFGVLPPLSVLTPEQAMYYFLSGYTAKVAGTERGIVEPKATFSACFGEAFLPLPPTTYAQLLAEKMRRHDTRAYLVNTGWSGGGYGVGTRMDIRLTRACLTAILDGTIDTLPLNDLPGFDLRFPDRLPTLPHQSLDPRQGWRNPTAYNAAVAHLASLFRDNFARYRHLPESQQIATAGPPPPA